MTSLSSLLRAVSSREAKAHDSTVRTIFHAVGKLQHVFTSRTLLGAILYAMVQELKSRQLLVTGLLKMLRGVRALRFSHMVCLRLMPRLCC